jgi:hypothetical protein
MRQKTLNKIAKYCKLQDMRIGQLVDILVNDWPGTQETMGAKLHAITDDQLEKNFNKFLKSFPMPTKDRGGYYPHGHHKSLPTVRNAASTPKSK